MSCRNPVVSVGSAALGLMSLFAGCVGAVQSGTVGAQATGGTAGSPSGMGGDTSTTGPAGGAGGTRGPSGSGGVGTPIGSGGSGTNTGSGGAASGSGGASAVPFAPAPGSLKRLTASSYRNSLRDLLGTLTIGDVEQDSWALGGLAAVGASQVSVSQVGVEDYQAAADAATTQVFADTARRDKLLGCVPKSATDTACFQQFVTAFGRLAFRHTLTAAQVTRFTQLTTTLVSTLGDTYEGMRGTMTAMLSSPYFLYRLERGAAPTAGAFWMYTSSEMASRLSYFLTNSTPDSTLLDLADKNGLQTADAVRAQADRLLSTTVGRQSIANFARDLFQLDIIASRAKDAAFSEYTPGLQAGMIQEIPASFAALVFDQKGSALDLFTTRNTVVNKELASLYGLSTTGLTTQSAASVTLPATTPRAGLFGAAGFLSLYASQKEGSPTQRGKFIREVILCQTIPPPPNNVSTVFVDPPAGVVYTKREKLTMHQSIPSCATCHKLMDPLGLTLENFDAIGKYRTTDQGKDIDVSGSLDGTDFNGPIELGQTIAKNPAAASCMVKSLYRYATGHVEVPSEASVVSDLANRFQSNGYHLRDLMLDLVATDGFRSVATPAP